jgi:TRAP-type C4-dicarboxylate transport system permease small subunit
VPDRVGQILGTLQAVLVLVFCSAFAYGSYLMSFQVAGQQYKVLPTSPPFTREWLYIFGVAAFILMMIYNIRDIRESLFHYDKSMFIQREEEIDEDISDDIINQMTSEGDEK